MIDRYSLPEMATLFDDEARFARWLEVELLATEAWSALGVVPVDDADCGRAHAPVVDGAFVAEVAARRQSPITTSPHSSTSCSSTSAARPGSGSTTGSRRPTWSTPHLLDARRGGRPPVDAASRSRSPCSTSRARAPRHGDGRSHPRRACRADDVRSQARAVVPSGRPRPQPASPRPRRDRGRQALGCGRHLLEHRPRGRGVGVRGLGLGRCRRRK